MTLSMKERGALGGQATVRKHGVEHMRAIGRVGFARLAARLSRRGACVRLQAKGRMPCPYPPSMTDAEVHSGLEAVMEAGYAAAVAAGGEDADLPF